MFWYRDSNLEGKIYVGDLSCDVCEKDLERVFEYYGRLRNVWVVWNLVGFVFVEYEDLRDVDDVVRGMDGT